MADTHLEALATAPPPARSCESGTTASAVALARDGWAATTVSATMITTVPAIRVFATGGIGGVHRGALGGGPDAPSLDIFGSDLRGARPDRGGGRLPRTKAILDLPLTLEYLETRGVR